MERKTLFGAEDTEDLIQQQVSIDRAGIATILFKYYLCASSFNICDGFALDRDQLVIKLQ